MMFKLLLILLLVLIIFGAGKLPKVMADLGKGLRNFREASQESNKQIEDEGKK